MFESKGWYKYIHIAAVANATIISASLVGIQYGLGGYSRTSAPIFCLADPSTAFVFAVVPACLINAAFLTLVVLLLFKIFDIGGWKLKTKVSNLLEKQFYLPCFGFTAPLTQNYYRVIPFLLQLALLLFIFPFLKNFKFFLYLPNTQGADETNTHYTSAQVKLVLTFFAYGFTNVINYSAYSVLLSGESAFSQALEEYFNCESTGMVVGKTCDRSIFEEIDRSRITFPLTMTSYIFMPLATLIYVSNGEKLIKKYWQKLKTYKTERKLSTNSSIWQADASSLIHIASVACNPNSHLNCTSICPQ